MKDFVKLMKSSPWSARFGMAVIVFYVFMAIFGPFLTPYGESQIVGAEFEPRGGEFVLGTDNLGRDMLTRLIYGARNTIGIAFATTCLAFFIGGDLRLSRRRRWAAGVDQVLSRIVDVLMAIPPLIFGTFADPDHRLGTSIPVYMIVVIAVIDSTRVFR